MLMSFIIFNILNVIIQTVKSIVTIKCNKYIAAVVNAIAYGLYTYIVVLTASDLDLWFKIAVTAGANLVGVFVVKWVEEKKRKEKLWKVEATISGLDFKKNEEYFNALKVPHNYIDIDKYVILNFYFSTCKQSELVKDFLNLVGAKYFVSESKIL